MHTPTALPLGSIIDKADGTGHGIVATQYKLAILPLWVDVLEAGLR
jgi:hypothetical protein